MSALGAVKDARPSYVKFERKAVEDRTASLAAGHYVAKDVDFAVITPQGSKDKIERVVADWFVQMQQQVKEGRLPEDWFQQYKAAYGYWQKGQEPPLNGTPIRGWTVLSPAIQENVIHANILTVEDLAQINDEAVRRIGMGALDCKEKAIAWLKAAAGPGKLTQEMAALQVRMNELASTNERLLTDNKEMKIALDKISEGKPKES